MEHIQFRMPGGRNLSALRHGPQSDRAIVFCHGPGGSGAALAPPESQLEAAGLSVLVPQRPGVGSSDLLPEYTVEEVVEDMVRLLRHLNIRSVYLCGWSAGAVYAARFAALHPDKAAGLGLISPALPLAGKRPEAWPMQWSRLDWFCRHWPALMRLRFKTKAARIARDAERELEKSLKNSPIADKIIFEQLYRRVALLNELRQAWQHEGRAVYADCRALCRCAGVWDGMAAPVDIWQGQADKVWTPEAGEVLHGIYPFAKLHLIPGEGRLMYLDHWPEIAARAAALLQ